MKSLYAAMGAILLLAVLFYNAYAQSYSPESMNLSSAINSTKAYLQSVNTSSYLIFYPDLKVAYSDLYLAMNQSFSNQSRAFALLNESMTSASAEQSRLNGYKNESAYILGGITVALGLALYVLMKPVRGRSGRAKAPKRE